MRELFSWGQRFSVKACLESQQTEGPHGRATLKLLFIYRTHARQMMNDQHTNDEPRADTWCRFWGEKGNKCLHFLKTEKVVGQQIQKNCGVVKQYKLKGPRSERELLWWKKKPCLLEVEVFSTFPSQGEAAMPNVCQNKHLSVTIHLCTQFSLCSTNPK